MKIRVQKPGGGSKQSAAKGKTSSSSSSSSSLSSGLKCHSLYLLVLGVSIISVEMLLMYRQFAIPSVDMADHGNPWLQQQQQQQQDYVLEDARANNDDSKSRRPQQDDQIPLPPRPDGTLNGYPFYYQELTTMAAPPLLSQFHCIGETNAEPYYWKRKRRHVDNTWMARSCHFELLCLDLQTKDFVLRLPRYANPDNKNGYRSHFESQQTIFTNVTARGDEFVISLGGINPKWGQDGYPRLKWFPKIEYYDPHDQDHVTRWSSFYTLPANVTLIPFHSLAAVNPGHLVWDDFLPLYTLQQIFLGENSLLQHTDPLFIRYKLSVGEWDGLWAGCDWRPEKTKDCDFMLSKFSPLMVSNPNTIPFTTQYNMQVNWTNSNNADGPKSNLVCARRGLAGIGALTDHGTEKGHGWEQNDYLNLYNQGRGGQLWRFRNFMLKNLNLPISTAPPPGPPYKIIFSEMSSKMHSRSISFGAHFDALRNATDLKHIVEPIKVRMKDYTLKEQAEMVGQASMYVTGCGGGAVTATFLPRGASLLVFYSEMGGIENNKGTGKPARLDFDYFNNMAYTRVHWLTQPKSQPGVGRQPTPEELDLFLEVVRHELKLLQELQQRQKVEL